MKNKMILAVGILIAANAFADVVSLKPIRQGKLRYRMYQVQMSKVGVVGKPLCSGEIDVPVYDLLNSSGSSWTWQNARITCDAETGQGPVQVEALVSTVIKTSPSLIDQVPAAEKEFSVDFFVTKVSAGVETTLYDNGFSAYSRDLSTKELDLNASTDIIESDQGTKDITDAFSMAAEFTDQNQ